MWRGEMQITRDFFDKIRRSDPKDADTDEVMRKQQRDFFIEQVWNDFSENAESMGFYLHTNKGKALEAFHLWNDDIDRFEKHEPDIDMAAHLKCAAYLTFWLRRSSPVDGFVCIDPRPHGITDETIEFMLKYGREYLAFDFGYRIAHAYETYINGRNLGDDTFSLCSFDNKIEQTNFVHTTCHVMKTKEISPLGIYLMFKAIFLRP
jgi:hypothetical protein